MYFFLLAVVIVRAVAKEERMIRRNEAALEVEVDASASVSQGSRPDAALKVNAEDKALGTYDEIFLAGTACPLGNSVQVFEADCEWLRDKAPFGFVLSAEIMQAHAAVAFATRGSCTMAGSVPDDVYRNWVLPHRILTEDPEPWRQPFNSILGGSAPGGACSSSSTDGAVVKVLSQLWSLPSNPIFMTAVWTALGIPAPTDVPGGNLSFIAGSPNAKVIRETLRTGGASSMGLSIFAVAALRSVGIPSRVVGVGQWNTVKGGAYYWVEYWSSRNKDGSDVWKFFDADPAQSVPLINNAWFVPTFTKFTVAGDQTYGVFAGGYNRDLYDSTMNINVPGSAMISMPSVEVTGHYSSLF